MTYYLQVSYCGFWIDDTMLFGRLLPMFENKNEPRKSITMKVGAVYRVIQKDRIN